MDEALITHFYLWDRQEEADNSTGGTTGAINMVSSQVSAVEAVGRWGQDCSGCEDACEAQNQGSMRVLSGSWFEKSFKECPAIGEI